MLKPWAEVCLSYFNLHEKGGLGLRFCIHSLYLLTEINLHMKLCWLLFHCKCDFLEYLWMKCPINSFLLVPWSKVNGNFVTSSLRNLVALFCFCCAKRCRFYGATFELNFFLRFYLLFQYDDKCFSEYSLQRKIGSKRLWRVIKQAYKANWPIR